MRKSIGPAVIGILLLSFVYSCVAQSESLSLVAQLDLWKSQGAEDGSRRLAELLHTSLESYDSVRDYRAFFYKEEREESSLGKKEKIFLKFEKPFKIFMKWLHPSRKSGVQVFYERGMHKNNLVVHKPGLLLGLMPIVFLDQNSPYVREGSAAYNIEDAGIGSFLTDLAEDVLKAAKENQLKVEFAPKESNGGQAVKITFAGSDETSDYMAYRVLVFFDDQTRLPVRMQLFDWQDRVTGIYSYEDLKLNLGASDSEFKSQSHRKLFKLYNHLE